MLIMICRFKLLSNAFLGDDLVAKFQVGRVRMLPSPLYHGLEQRTFGVNILSSFSLVYKLYVYTWITIQIKVIAATEIII